MGVPNNTASGRELVVLLPEVRVSRTVSTGDTLMQIRLCLRYWRTSDVWDTGVPQIRLYLIPASLSYRLGFGVPNGVQFFYFLPQRVPRNSIPCGNWPSVHRSHFGSRYHIWSMRLARPFFCYEMMALGQLPHHFADHLTDLSTIVYSELLIFNVDGRRTYFFIFCHSCAKKFYPLWKLTIWSP